MGGDFAPRNAVLGTVEAQAANPGLELYLVGDKQQIADVLVNEDLKFDHNYIVHADEVIGMDESPMQAIKAKPQSSLVVGAKLIKDNKADAFVSAGNTGAMMAVSTLIIGRITGVGRPTIGATFPTQNYKGCTLYDVGASVDSKPTHLLEYALMGSIYEKEIKQNPNPKVGLLSVGEEESKGNELTVATLKLLKESGLNFVGNVEGRDILKGEVDIIVCDGFVGNVILKFGEAVPAILKARIKSFAEKSLLNKLKALVVKFTLRDALKDFDYQEYGGVPLLGIDGISIIGHGSSSPLAFRNMILKAMEMHDKKLIQKFEEALKDYAADK